MRPGLVLGLVLLALTAGAAQENPREETGESEADDRPRYDFSSGFQAFSEDLQKWLRSKKILGAFAIAEGHVFPAQESGPYLGPPLRLWGHGFGTSLWRDPVTGWPLQ